MSEFNIEVEGGSSVRLPTAGKYCDRDIVVTAKGGGQEVFYNSNGQFYIKEVVSPKVGAALENLYSIYGIESIYAPEITSCGHYSFGNIWNVLKKLVLPKLTSSVAYGCRGSQYLEEAQLGSVGYPVTSLGSFFINSGQYSKPQITIYVDASTLADIPSDVIKNSPFGCSNATIIYRNSTTGEVITE